MGIWDRIRRWRSPGPVAHESPGPALSSGPAPSSTPASSSNPAEPDAPNAVSANSSADEVHSRRLTQAVGALSVVATQDFAVDELLSRLCEVAVDALEVDGAGVMDFKNNRSRFVKASTPQITSVERLQEALQAGPCWDAAQAGHAVTAASAEEISHRWPSFAAAAAQGGIEALLVVPLVSRGRTWGALDLYRMRPGPWSREQVDAAHLLADVAVSFLVMAEDREAARVANAELAGRALHDPLTGLPNRTLMHELIDHAVAGAGRHRSTVAVLFIDLDRFKSVNDTYGHVAGDTVLFQVSQRMSSVLRAGDTLGRLSGDEFLLLCEDFPTEPAIEVELAVTRLADRLRQAINVPITVDDKQIQITGSVGVALTTDRPSATDFIHEADVAMYQAKARGRDAVVLQPPPGAEPSNRRQGLDRGLLHAVDRRELRVHYQPIVSVDGYMTAVEALVRWEHPEYGLITAADFVNLAQSNGSIVGLGRWVLEQVCTDLRGWRDTYGADAPERVLCNVSPTELASPGLLGAIAELLSVYGLIPSDLGLEILESDFAHNKVIELLKELQDRGHSLAVDDFGTGYSSLARLVDLPVTYVKVDKSFVARLPADTRSRRLVEAIAVIAARLDIIVVGEGVETTDQARALVEAGCQLLQGFLYSPAIPAEEIPSLISSRLPLHAG